MILPYGTDVISFVWFLDLAFPVCGWVDVYAEELDEVDVKLDDDSDYVLFEVVVFEGATANSYRPSAGSPCFLLTAEA